MRDARLVEYFAVIGPRLTGRPSVTATVGADGQPEASVLHCFPARPECAVPPHALPPYCFPRGGLLSPTEIAEYGFESVLSDADGRRVYVVLAIVNRPLTPQECLLTNGMKHAATCLALVSRYALLAEHRAFLGQLVRISRSHAPLPLERFVASYVRETPLPPRGVCRVSLTIGDLAMWLMRPAPNEYPHCDASVIDYLYECLSPECIILVWSLLMTERRIVLISRDLALLSRVALALLALLTPFEWQGVVIPACPVSFLNVIMDAPVPFIVGGFAEVPERVEAHQDELVFVDLNRGEVLLPPGEESPVLPQKPLVKLLAKLKAVERAREKREQQGGKRKPRLSLVNDMRRQITEWSSTHGVIQRDEPSAVGSVPLVAQETREAFSRFFAATMRDYESCFGERRPGPLRVTKSLVQLGGAYVGARASPPPTTTRKTTSGVRFSKTDTPRFDVENFLSTRDHAARPWFAEVVQTQLFEAFVREAERLNSPKPAPPGASETQDMLRFFRETCAAKQNRSTMALHRRATPFLNEEIWKFNETFIVPPPSSVGVDLSLRFDAGREATHGGAGPLCPFSRLDHSRYPPKLRPPKQLAEREPLHREFSDEVRSVLRRFLDGSSSSAAGDYSQDAYAPRAAELVTTRPFPSNNAFVATLNSSATLLEAAWRSTRARRAFRRTLSKIIRSQSLFRSRSSRNRYLGAVELWFSALLDVIFAAWQQVQTSFFHRAALIALSSGTLSNKTAVTPAVNLAFCVEEVAALHVPIEPPRNKPRSSRTPLPMSRVTAGSYILAARLEPSIRRLLTEASQRQLMETHRPAFEALRREKTSLITLARLSLNQGVKTPRGSGGFLFPSDKKIKDPNNIWTVTNASSQQKQPFFSSSATDLPDNQLAAEEEEQALLEQLNSGFTTSQQQSPTATNELILGGTNGSSAGALSAERTTIYNGLKNLSEEHREALFAAHLINDKKKRKRTLTRSLWTKRDLAEASAVATAACAPRGALEATAAVARSDAARRRILSSFAVASFASLSHNVEVERMKLARKLERTGSTGSETRRQHHHHPKPPSQRSLTTKPPLPPRPPLPTKEQ